jgi:hypothetical protein
MGLTPKELGDLGDLALAAHKGAELDRQVARTIENHTRAGTPPWLAGTRVDWAESLLRRGDEALARELALAALDNVGELELTVTRNRAKARCSIRPPDDDAVRDVLSVPAVTRGDRQGSQLRLLIGG